MSDIFCFRRALELPNARLVLDLAHKAKANNSVASGQLSHFDDVPSNWRCPCCTRTKRGISRLNARDELYCPIHRHHDHVADDLDALRAQDSLRLETDYAGEMLAAFKVYMDSCCRFADIFICCDCNRADAEAKRSVKAPPYFTFAPFEIAQFIGIYLNSGHDLVKETVKQIYSEALPQVERLRARARDLASRVPDEMLAAYTAGPRYTMPE